MRDALMLSITFVSAYSAFGCFALSQLRHWQAAGNAGQLSRCAVRALRTAGGFLIVLSCVAALAHEGLDYGALLFCTIVSIAALCVAATLTWYPRALRFLALPIRR